MSPPLAALAGARVRRVDLPEPDLLALSLALPRRADAADDPDREDEGAPRTVLLLSTAGSEPSLGCVGERPRGRPAEGVAKQLRNHLDGARIERAIDAGGGALALDLRRGPAALALIHEALGERSNVLVLDGDGAIAAALHPDRLAALDRRRGDRWTPPEADAPARDLPADLPALRALGDALLDARQGTLERALRRALERSLGRARRRMERRAEATLGDLERAEIAPRLRDDASAILAALTTIPPGATSVVVPDWASDPPGERTIAIDPARGPRRTADALFHRARKLDAGRAIAAARHDEAMATAAAIDALLARLAGASADELPAIEAEARRLGAPAEPTEPAARRRARAPAAHQPFRRYTGHGDRTILVGKGGADNDALTFQHASPHDLWIHLRGAPGSHVIVPLARGETCPPELLIDAAHLAAHFSSARGEPLVEIQHTVRKHLRKPKRGAPGLVVVTNERTFVLRVEPARLERLLRAAPGA